MPVSKKDDNGEKKLGSYAEVAAMKFNLKEGRYLKKNLHLIELEKQSSLNLINLDNRDVRLRYKKLKDNVEKIKSHLTATEISEMRKLDVSGKLDGVHTSVMPNLYARITAEAKRLNINPNPRPSRPATVTLARRPKQPSPDDSYREPIEEPISARPQSEDAALLRRRETIRNALLRNNQKADSTPIQHGVSQKLRAFSRFKQFGSQHKGDSKDVEYEIYDPSGVCVSAGGDSASQLQRSTSHVPETSRPIVTVKRSQSQKETLTATLPTEQDTSSLSGRSNVASPTQRKLAFMSETDSINHESATYKPPRRPKNRPARPLSSVQHIVIDENEDLDDSASSVFQESVLSQSVCSSAKNVPQTKKGKMKITSTKTYTAEDVAQIRGKGSRKNDYADTRVTPSSVSERSGCTSVTDSDRNDVPSPRNSVVSKDDSQTIRKGFRKYRPATTTGGPERTAVRPETAKRPQTSKTLRIPSGHGVLKKKFSRSNSFLMSSMGGASSANTAFSCHTAAEKDAREESSPRSDMRVETGRTRQLQDEIQDNLGENIHRELRRDLLQKEKEATGAIGDRISGFMKRLDNYIQRAKKEEERVNMNFMKFDLKSLR